MRKETNLRFLSEKLSELHTGLFFNQSDAVLKVQPGIVELIKVDDAGQLWFFLPRPKQHLNEFEKAFLSRINFYQKGKDFFIRTVGTAYIVDDPEEITGLVEMADEVKKVALSEKILIKVKVGEVDYYETGKKEREPFLRKVTHEINNLIFHHAKSYKPYRYYQHTVA